MSPEKHLLDWQASQTIAESMSPIIGQLYRLKGVEIILFGKTLINAATIDIIKTHRIARRYTDSALSLDQTMPILQRISELDLSPCRIDIGKLRINSGSSMMMSTTLMTSYKRVYSAP